MDAATVPTHRVNAPRRSRRNSALALCLLLASAPSAGAIGFDLAGRARDNVFIEAMVRMMDAFGLIDLDRYRGGSPSSMGGNPWSSWTSPTTSWPGMTGMPMTGMPMGGWPGGGPSPQTWTRQPWDQAWKYAPYGNQGNPYGNDPARAITLLSGIWRGRAGAVLLIRRGLYRLYVDRDRYQEGYLRAKGDILMMRDADTGRITRYQVRLQRDLLLLRASDGRVAQFKRIRSRRLSR